MILIRHPKALAVLLLTVVTCACAALQPPNAAGPAPSGPPYPVVVTEQSQRREAALGALNRIARTSGPGDQLDAYLQPVTATVKSLPASPAAPLLLPKVGSNVEMNEDETREALRRFINESSALIGANPSQLSLIERTDKPDRTKIALYEQRVFRYPLRGGYGKLQIHFTADRRLLDLTSTCIPDAERLLSSLSGVTPRLTSEDAIKRVRESGVRHTDSFGNQQTFSVTSSNELNSRELVTYVLPSTGSLEIHIAWEVMVTNAPFKTVYVDALNDSIIAVN